MSTSLTIQKAPRPRCDWRSSGETNPCTRAANYQVISSINGHTVGCWWVCYRHRWRLRDQVQSYPESELAKAIDITESKPE